MRRAFARAVNIGLNQSFTVHVRLCVVISSHLSVEIIHPQQQQQYIAAVASCQRCCNLHSKHRPHSTVHCAATSPGWGPAPDDTELTGPVARCRRRRSDRSRAGLGLSDDKARAIDTIQRRLINLLVRQRAGVGITRLTGDEGAPAADVDGDEVMWFGRQWKNSYNELRQRSTTKPALSV